MRVDVSGRRGCRGRGGRAVGRRQAVGRVQHAHPAWVRAAARAATPRGVHRRQVAALAPSPSPSRSGYYIFYQLKQLSLFFRW